MIVETALTRRAAAPPREQPGRAPFAVAYAAGVAAALAGLATGRLSLAAGAFLTSLLSVLYLARPATAIQCIVLYWPFHEILYLFAEGERIVLWADATLAVLTLLWVSRGLIQKEPLLPRSSITGAVLVFLGVLLLSLVRAPNALAGFMGFKWWAMHLPLYFLAAHTRLDARRAVGLVLSLVLACAVKCLFHVGQLEVGGSFFPSSFPVGGEGLEAHSSYVCLYALVWIMGWAMWPYVRAQTGRLLLSAGMLFILIVVGLSLLRVTWMVVAVGAVTVVLLARDLPLKRTALLLCLGAAAWSIAPGGWRDRLMITFDPSPGLAGSVPGYSAGVKARTIRYYVTRHLTGEGPTTLADQGLWGGGLGAVTSHDARKWIGAEALSVSAPESTLADAFIELGWLGFLAYLAIQLCLVWESYRLARLLRDARLRAFAAGVCACALATLVADMATEFSYAASTYYWYLAGLIVALRNTLGPQPAIRTKPLPPRGRFGSLPVPQASSPAE